jgi:hypothetical protein
MTNDSPSPGVDSAMVSVGTFTDYAMAQQAVDHLSDNRFPVEHAAIVGTGLKLVENILGRWTVGRAAVAGLTSGAWFGLFIGFLLGLFAATTWWAPVLAGVVVGAIWGAIFGALAHALTRGRRDFTSTKSLQADQYAVMVGAEHVDAARQLLIRLNWQANTASGSRVVSP